MTDGDDTETPQDPTAAQAGAPDGDQDGTEAEDGAAASRRKFREALDRKQFGHHGQGGVSADPKSRAPHASPAKPQRTFRRKSG